jgi:hypothetical protein
MYLYMPSFTLNVHVSHINVVDYCTPRSALACWARVLRCSAGQIAPLAAGRVCGIPPAAPRGEAGGPDALISWALRLTALVYSKGSKTCCRK